MPTLTASDRRRRFEETIKDYRPSRTEGAGEQPQSLTAEQVSAAAQAVEIAPQYCGARLSTSNFLLYTKVQAYLENADEEQYVGNAWGVSGLGTNTGWGDLYTSDYEALISSTKSFMFTFSPTYCALYFYDSHSNLLGDVQVGGIGSGAGMGGGTGDWLHH